MSENVKEIQADRFDNAIRDGIVLVDFWAPWCGPCRMQEPILDQVASEIGTKASIIKVNVDESPSVAAQFGIKGIPTLILFKGGKAVGQYVGVQRKDTLVAAIGQVSGN